MAIGDILDETVGDLEDAWNKITYPLSKKLLKVSKFKYDFHIKKKGHIWLYVDSTDHPHKWKNHKKATEEGGGRWRIVESATAKIIDEGGKPEKELETADDVV